MRGIIVVLLLIIGSISGFGSTFSVTTTADGLTCHDSGDTSAACMVQDPPYQTPFTISGAQAQVNIQYVDPYRSFLLGSFNDYTAAYNFNFGALANDNITVQFTVPTYWGNFGIGYLAGGGYDQSSNYSYPELISLNSGQCLIAPDVFPPAAPCLFSHVVGTQQTVSLSLNTAYRATFTMTTEVSISELPTLALRSQHPSRPPLP